MLFSEGIPLTTASLGFLGVIDAANRANVSIYTVDAAGLRTESAQRTCTRTCIYGAGQRGFEIGYRAPRSAAEPLGP